MDKAFVRVLCKRSHTCNLGLGVLSQPLAFPFQSGTAYGIVTLLSVIWNSAWGSTLPRLPTTLRVKLVDALLLVMDQTCGQRDD